MMFGASYETAASAHNANSIAPHLRGGVTLATVMRWWGLALSPCLLFGLWNTGYQANAALAALGPEAATWRAPLLEGLGLGVEPGGLVSSLVHGLLYFLPVYAVAAATTAVWERIFARLRGQPVMAGGLVSALLFTLILPPAAPLWQVALGISFGIVVGKEIFGGTGKNFMNPPLLGIAFLYLAYPTAMQGDPIWTGIGGYGGTTTFVIVAAEGIDGLAMEGVTWTRSFLGLVQGGLGDTSALACLMGAALLVAWGFASWRVIVATALGAVAAGLLFDVLAGPAAPAFAVPWYWHLALGSFAFGAVFLATDPASAAATNRGRWIYGLLVGFMIVLIRVANPAHPDGVVFAVLFGNVFAPLIDYAVIRANMRRRARRNV